MQSDDNRRTKLLSGEEAKELLKGTIWEGIDWSKGIKSIKLGRIIDGEFVEDRRGIEVIYVKDNNEERS